MSFIEQFNYNRDSILADFNFNQNVTSFRVSNISGDDGDEGAVYNYVGQSGGAPFYIGSKDGRTYYVQHDGNTTWYLFDSGDFNPFASASGPTSSFPWEVSWAVTPGFGSGSPVFSEIKLQEACSPIYGSSVTFSASNSSWRGSNYYQFVMPNGFNSIKAEMDLTFQGDKTKIKNLLYRIQNATTGVITGDIAFSGTEDCINFGEFKHGVQIDLDTDYYQNFSGSQISNYNLKHISSDVYELNVSMFNDRVSPILNHGMGFVVDRTKAITESSFEEFDVAAIRNLALFDNDEATTYTDFNHVRLDSDINLDGEFEINWSVIFSGFTNNIDTFSGAHLFSNNPAGGGGQNDRIIYYHNASQFYMNIDSTALTWANVSLNTGVTYDMKVTRNSNNQINFYLDGVKNATTRTNANTITLNGIGGIYNEGTNIPSLIGTIFDISIKSGTNLTEIYNANGYGTGESNWSSSINGHEFNATISGALKEYYVGSKNSQVFDNYFYLTGSRSSAVMASNISGLATYTGIADDATRTFFWEPDQQVSLPVDHGARINDFKRSFTQQLNISRNQNRIDALDLTFTNRSEKETYSILHFLESHLGYKQFVYYYDDDIIQQNRVFFCPQWKHTFNYKDSNTIEARFIEIVAPVTPEF